MSTFYAHGIGEGSQRLKQVYVIWFMSFRELSNMHQEDHLTESSSKFMHAHVHQHISNNYTL